MVENLVFPKAVETEFDKIGAGSWEMERVMLSKLVKQVQFFPAPIIDII